MPLILFLRPLIGVGNQNSNEEYVFEYNEGIGKVDIQLHLGYQHDNTFSYSLMFMMSTTGNVKIITLSFVESFNYRNSVFVEKFYKVPDHPIIGWAGASLISLYKNDNLSCIGVAEMRFNADGTIQNETINFNIGIILNLDPGMIPWINFGITFLQILYFLSILVFVIHFYRKIRGIKKNI